jgi:hypothetical protein
LLDKRASLLRDQLRGFEQAQGKAEADRINKAGIDAKDYLDKLGAEVKGVRAVTKELDIYHQKLAAFRAAGGVRSAADVAIDEAGIRKKFEGAGANSDAEAVLKKQLEGQLKAIKDFGEQRKAAVDYANSQVRAAYDDGLLSLQQVNEAEAQARAGALRAQLADIDKQLSALRAYEKAAQKPQDRQNAENQIAEALRKRADVATEAGRKEVTAAHDAARAVEVLARSYTGLLAQILELEGNHSGAAGLRIAEQIGEAQKTAAKLGLDTGIVDRYAAQLEAQRDVNDLQDKYGRLLERTQMQEESIALAATRNGTSELDTMRQVTTVRQQALEQLRKLTDAAVQLAIANPQNSGIVALAERLSVEFEKASAQADTFLGKLRSAGGEAAAAISHGFEDALVSGAKLSDTLKQIDKDLERIVLRQAVTKPFEDWLTGAIGGNGQASGGGGWIGSFLSAIGFGGGKAIGGRTDPYTVVPIAENRPEVVGDGSRQWLITGRRSYSVDPNPSLSSGSGRGVTVVNNFHMVGQLDLRTQNQQAAKVALSVRNANARNN